MICFKSWSKKVWHKSKFKFWNFLQNSTCDTPPDAGFEISNWMHLSIGQVDCNKANLRDLIAATGLVILLKFDPNHRFFSLVTLKFDGWPLKTIGHLFYTTSSFVHHFKSIGELKLKLQSGNTQFGSKSAIFCPVWPWNLMDDLRKQ